ncbi:MFS transporter [Lentzea sp. CC55]|uniref:MFS transporter n=1 Tax=Lentzea sp. CC55 TaxID=2884909 RepID=UPI0027E0D93F|nr:MFS transporter [Lentzea sp. CC55]MCG8927371.1 MFS transporter [Lentzea sp. CC55]
MSTSTPSPPKADQRAWWALGILVLAVVLLTVDGTVLYLAIPSLSAELDPSTTELLWIGDIYSFALGGLLITMGNLADRVGRKRLLLIGSALFGVASLVAAMAPSAELLIAARALLGVAGATIMPSTLSIVRNLFLDPKQRTRAIAIWSAGATAGAAVGPLVGGVLLEHFYWGSVFLINVPIMVVIVIGGALLLPESRADTRKPIDLGSAALSVVMIIGLVYAIKHVFSDGFDWKVALSAAIGLVAGWFFLRRQGHLEQPLVDVSLFRIPAFSGAVLSNALSSFAFTGLLFFFSQYLQLVRDLSPLEAGIAELPGTAGSMVVIGIIGFVAAKLGVGRSIGLGHFLVGLALLGIGLTVHLETYWGLGISLAVLGFGVGTVMTLSTDAMVSAVPKERSGAASSIAETGYELGIAMGIAVLGSLHARMYRNHLDIPAGTDPAKAHALNDSLAAGTAVLTDPADASLLRTAEQAFTDAMTTSSIIAACIVFAVAVMAWRVIPATAVGKGEH